MEINKNYSLCDSKGEYLDNKLDKLFGHKESGFFIELGAHNGLLQSNTAFLEKNRSWTGILIEPNCKNFELCKINRPNSICYNYACVSEDYKDEFIYGDFELLANEQISLMSSINGSRLNNKTLSKVSATTLTKILDKHDIKKIDLLSLDVEGYEYFVLKGLDFSKYKPEYLLIEVYNYDYEKIYNFLKDKNYKMICNFSDYNIKNNPNWDGSHNDYLFRLL